MAEFAGFGPELFAFLEELRAHNERPWFEANKHRYESAVREPALAFVEAMAPRLAAVSPALVADARKAGGSLMRIHRDVRFSKDPSPYKTNLGIQFRHQAGKDVHAPGLYFHVDPEESFMAAGLWHPEPEALKRIREAITARPEAWVAARDDDAFRGRWRLAGGSLKRAPRGFDPEHPLVDDLKRTDFIAVRDLAPEDVLGSELPDRAAAAYASASPLMRFLCGAIGLDY